MRLLVTRPEPEATRTAERLRGLGHLPLVQPLLAVEFLPAPEDLADPAAILVTSRNALRAIGHWPAVARWHSVPVFAVGEQTAAAARAMGFADVRAGSGDGGDLAGLVAGTVAPGVGPLFYPAAEERASGLEAKLRTGGYELHTVVAYRMNPATGFDEPVRAAIAAGEVDGVLLYSQRTAVVFRDLVIAAGLRAALRGSTLFTLSQGVAGAVRHLAAQAVRVAARPDEDALLSLLPPGS